MTHCTNKLENYQNNKVFILLDIMDIVLFLKRYIVNRYVNMGKIADTYIRSIQNNREVTMSKQSKYIKAQPEVAPISDPRFTSQKFRNAVRLVLEFLSEEPNFGSFKKYDSASGSQFPIDWVVFAKSLEHPVRYATCFVRCNNPRVSPIGSRVQTPKGFLTETVALPGVTRDEAIKELNTKIYEFKEWRN